MQHMKCFHYLAFIFLPVSLWCFEADLAHTLYQASFKDAKEGVHEKDGYVIFISDIPLNGAGYLTRETNFITAESLRYHHKLVSSFLIERNSLTRPELPSDSLLSIFPDLDDFIGDQNDHFFDHLVAFDSPCAVLENDRDSDKDILRYAVAYLLSDLEGVRLSGIPWPSNSRILAELQKIYALNVKLGRKKIISKFHDVTYNYFHPLGTAFNDLRAGMNLRLKSDFSDIGMYQFYRNFHELHKILEGNQTTYSNAKLVLDSLPLYPQALEVLQKHYLVDDPMKARALFLCRLSHNSLSNGSNIEGVFSTKNLSDPTNLEFSTLVSQINQKNLLEKFSDHHEFRENFYKAGFVDFDVPVYQEESPSYQEALSLFKKGRNLQDIVSLSLDSVSENPFDPETWNLLGRSLSLVGDDLLAVPCLIHSILIHTEDASIAKTNLALALKNIGCANLSQGLALSVLLQTDVGSWQYNKSLEVLDIKL
jgi:hypothetical protein